MNKTKIISFRDLVVWKEGHCLVLLVYKTTDLFPEKETFALTNQMRRCAVSITSNIAEGFSRQGKKEKLQFYFIAKGSLTELENQLIIARDIEYISEEKYFSLLDQVDKVGRLLTGLIKSQQSR